MLALNVFPSVPPQWDELAHGFHPVASRRWIEIGVHRLGDTYRIFALNDEQGVVAALGGTVLHAPLASPRVDPYAILSGRSAESGLLPDGPHPWHGLPVAAVMPTCLFMYPHYASFPVGKGARDPSVLRDFLRQLRGWAEMQRLASLSFLFLAPGSEALVAALRAEGAQVVQMTNQCSLPVTWTDFPGYLRTLPSKRRLAAGRELRRLAAQQVVLADEGVDDVRGELLDLRAKVTAKYHATVTPDKDAGLLDRIRHNFGSEEICVTTARHDGRLLSYMLFLQDGEHWTALFNGSDYDDPRASYAYFATAFYQAASLAPRCGVTEISYGLGSWHAKQQRGCKLVPLHAAELRLGTNAPRPRSFEEL
jgi:uncharacterized protein